MLTQRAAPVELAAGENDVVVVTLPLRRIPKRFRA